MPCTGKLLCTGIFLSKLFEKLTFYIKKDYMDELDHSEKKNCIEFLPVYRVILKTWEFITKFYNCTINQIHLFIVNLVFQTELTTLLSLNQHH